MAEKEQRRRISPKLVAAAVIIALLVAFWAANRDEVMVDFVAFDAQVRLWVALAVATFLGFAAGLLVARSRRD